MVIESASLKNNPNMPPTALVVKGMSAASATFCRPLVRERVISVNSSKKFGSEIKVNVVNPALMATGLPESVPAW